jgi:hypothetical protein
MQSVSRDFVRDHLFRSWQGFAQRPSHQLQYDLRGLGLRGNVFVHVCDIGFAHRDFIFPLDF